MPKSVTSECPRDLAHHTSRVGGRRWTARAQPLAKRLALDIAHHAERDTARFADAMDRDDVWVREASRRARLLHKALTRLGVVGKVGRQDIDRDVAIQVHIARKVDDSHPAPDDFRI